MTRLDQLEYNWQNQDEIKWKSKGKKGVHSTQLQLQ